MTRPGETAPGDADPGFRARRLYELRQLRDVNAAALAAVEARIAEHEQAETARVADMTEQVDALIYEQEHSADPDPTWLGQHSTEQGCPCPPGLLVCPCPCHSPAGGHPHAHPHPPSFGIGSGHAHPGGEQEHAHVHEVARVEAGGQVVTLRDVATWADGRAQILREWTVDYRPDASFSGPQN